MDRVQSIYKGDEDVHVEPRPQVPNVERDLQLAKRYLQKLGDENESLWTHLIEVIHRILTSKKMLTPAELHLICRRLREKKLRVSDWMIDLYQEKLFLRRSMELIDLFTKPKYKWNWEDRTPDPNKLIDEKYFVKMRMKKDMGFCLPEKEIFDILFAMRTLADNIVVARAVFWGKIFGIFRDYYIVECDVEPAELERMRLEEEERLNQQKMKEEEERIEKEKLAKEEAEKLAKEEKERLEREKREKKREKRREKERKRQEKIEKMEKLKQKRIEIAKRMGRSVGEIGEDLLKAEFGGEGKKKKKEEEVPAEPIVEEPPPPPPPVSLFDKYIIPKLPVSKPRVKIEVPVEPYGEGLNKKEYYVCNLPGEPWIKLPDVTPAQIAISRRIKKFLTGDLEADVISMPPFPGKEKNYLRAMIARIAASTEVAPLGFYSGGGGEGYGGEGGEGGEAKVNPEFRGISWTKLFHSSQSYWVHCHPYILPQGRLKWWKPPKIKDEDERPRGEDEEEGEGEEIKPERGPPILRAINRDKSEDTRPWSISPSTIVIKKGLTIMARSNIWPGACSTALEFNYQYMYIGWGMKFSQYGYTPPFMPPPALEYEVGPEIMEILDPTAEEEEAWRIAHLPKEPKPFAGEGGEGVPGEGGPAAGDEEETEEDEEEEE